MLREPPPYVVPSGATSEIVPSFLNAIPKYNRCTSKKKAVNELTSARFQFYVGQIVKCLGKLVEAATSKGLFGEEKDTKKILFL